MKVLEGNSRVRKQKDPRVFVPTVYPDSVYLNGEQRDNCGRQVALEGVIPAVQFSHFTEETTEGISETNGTVKPASHALVQSHVRQLT